MPTATLAPKPTPTKPTSQEHAKLAEGFDLYRWLVDPAKFRPPIFFIGIAIGLLVCSLAGRNIAKKNFYHNFQRFHRFISPAALFYPTTSQMMAIAESGSTPEQTIVIIGGNSIFNGLGQNAEDLWTVHLQQILGKKFAVFNFAMPAADPFEGAYWASEALLKKHRKVIFVTTAIPGKCGLPYGTDVYGYAFWDAREKRLLFKDNDRNKAIEARLKTLPEKEQIRLAELQLRMKLDSLLYFEDLWTAAGYSKLFTVWTGLTAGSPLKPRTEYADERYTPPPMKERFNGATDLMTIRCYNRSYFEINTCTPRPSFWSKYLADMNYLVPYPLRQNCLVTISTHAPASLALLNDMENTREKLGSEMSQDCWKKAGYNCLSMRGKLASEDFLDSRHLIASGGKKVANEVAGEVTKMASKLGYM